MQYPREIRYIGNLAFEIASFSGKIRNCSQIQFFFVLTDKKNFKFVWIKLKNLNIWSSKTSFDVMKKFRCK